VHLEDARGAGVNLESAGEEEPDGWESHFGRSGHDRSRGYRFGSSNVRGVVTCEEEFRRELFVFLSLL
jgi:hypothetical protein